MLLATADLDLVPAIYLASAFLAPKDAEVFPIGAPIANATG